MSAPERSAPRQARDFTFIKPQARRLTEYEALTVHQQPDALGFDLLKANFSEPEWYLLRVDGRTLWDADSTRLKCDDWFAYRDPAQHWQRTYVRQQEQQETSVARVTEDAGLDGALAALDPRWVRDVLCGHYRAWSFFDYAIFRTLAPAQREALSDTLGNVLVFQSFDHLRHAQDVVIYLVELENYHTAVDDAAGKRQWLEAAEYQPARKLAEDIMATTDWGELMVGLNLVVGPYLQRMAVSDLVRRMALPNNDPVASHIVMTAERDRRRNLAAAESFTRMMCEGPHAGHNRAVIADWLANWGARAVAAAAALAPVYALPPVCAVSYAESEAAARAATDALLTGLDFPPLAGGRKA